MPRRVSSTAVAWAMTGALASAQAPPEKPSPAPVSPAAPAPPVSTGAGPVVRIHDLSGLVNRIPDAPAPDIELKPPSSIKAGGAGAPSGLDEWYTRVFPAEVIVSVVKDTVAPAMWEQGDNSIQLTADAHLYVVHTAEVQEEVARFLASLRRAAGPQVAVTATLAIVEDAFLDAWRAKSASPVALTDESAQALADALAARQHAWRVRDMRVVARNGQRVGLLPVTEHAYIQNYDLKTTEGEMAAAPIAGCLRVGTGLTVRPWVTGDRFLCEVRFAHTDATLPIPRFDTGVKGMGELGLPETTYTGLSTTVTGRIGQTLLAGRVEVVDLKAPPKSPARSLCLFLRPTVVPREPVEPPAPDAAPEALLRIIDVGLLEFGPDDCHAQPLGLTPGPVAPAQPEKWGSETICLSDWRVETIKTTIARGSWEQAGNALDLWNGFLVVRNAPAVLDQVQRFVEVEIARQVRVVVTRVDVLAVEPEAYENLAARLPAWRAGTMRLGGAEAADLLARAARGEDGLRLAASAEAAGMSARRFCLQRLGSQAYVREYAREPSSNGSAPAPQVDVAADGLALDCRAALADDGKSVDVDLQARYAELERPVAVLEAKDDAPKVHVPTLASATFRAAVAVEAGGALMVGGGGPFKVGGKERHLLAIVRCSPAP